MRIVALISIMAWTPFCWQPLNGQSSAKAPQNDKSKAAHEQAVAANDKSLADQLSAAIDKLTAEVASWKKQEGTTPSKNDAPSDIWLKGSTIVEALATVAIAILAYFQWRTLQKHGTALEALAERTSGTLSAIQRQGDLMEAQFDQWVDTANWKIRKGTNPAFEPFNFECTADLLNKSNFPMTLTDGHIIIGESAPFRVGGLLLSPNLPNPILIQVTTQRDNPTSFAVEWTFSHRHKITGAMVSHDRKAWLTWAPLGADGYWWDAKLVVFGPHDEGDNRHQS